MIAYDELESPIGRLWVAVSERGLCRIEFDVPEEEFVADLRRRFGQEPAREPAAAATARTQLLEYLAGERKTFELPVDLHSAGEFQARVWSACRAIPYGGARSYGELARELGRPGAARAVGNALARNPLPLVIPCHRVRRSEGALGGFRGGPAAKEWLLNMEAGRTY